MIQLWIVRVKQQQRLEMGYKEYVTFIDSEEKLEKLKSMKSNIELYKYLIQ